MRKGQKFISETGYGGPGAGLLWMTDSVEVAEAMIEEIRLNYHLEGQIPQDYFISAKEHNG